MTRWFRAENLLASVGTSRYVFVPTTNLTTIILSTGYTGIRIFNSGSNTLIFGDTTINTNSGNFLYPGMTIDFGFVQDHFSFSMIADSANSYISINEYK